MASMDFPEDTEGSPISSLDPGELPLRYRGSQGEGALEGTTGEMGEWGGLAEGWGGLAKSGYDWG